MFWEERNKNMSECGDVDEESEDAIKRVKCVQMTET